MPNITWSQIESECGDYRSGFVATFRKYEGMDTDEKDAYGRTVKVTATSFAEHVGIDRTTFARWIRKMEGSAPPISDSNEARARRATRVLPAAEKAKLAAELLEDEDVAEALAEHRPDAVVEALGRSASGRDRMEETLSRHIPAPTPKVGPSSTPDAIDLIADLRTMHRTLDRIASAVAAGTAVINGDMADALVTEVDWLINALDVIKSGVRSGSLDEELARLVEEESR